MALDKAKKALKKMAKKAEEFSKNYDNADTIICYDNKKHIAFITDKNKPIKVVIDKKNPHLAKVINSGIIFTYENNSFDPIDTEYIHTMSKKLAADQNYGFNKLKERNLNPKYKHHGIEKAFFKRFKKNKLNKQ
jgi:hypothetical protein